MIIDLVGSQAAVDLVIGLSNQAHEHDRVEFQMLVDEAVVRLGVLRVENRSCRACQDTFHR